jgi:hypothetical protein
MNPLANPYFNPAEPLQTLLGTQQALKCGHNKVRQLIREKKLATVHVGKMLRVTTESILAYAKVGDGKHDIKGLKPKKRKAS